MIVIAHFPSMTYCTAPSQLSAAWSVFTYRMSPANRIRASFTSGPSHGVSPVHSPLYRSGPMLPRSTLSRRWTAAQIPLSPRASGVIPRRESSSHTLISSSRFWGGRMWAAARILVLYQRTLER